MTLLRMILIYLSVLMIATVMMLQMVAASPNDLVDEAEADLAVSDINTQNKV